MKIPPEIPVYGDMSFRGACPREDIEQMSIINKLRLEYPDTFGAVAIHPRNEGLRTNGQFGALVKYRAEGMTKGASDLIIPGDPSFVCEIKRQDHTKSKIHQEQIDYLLAAKKAGCFVCVALGAKAAWEAFLEWKGKHYD